MVNMRYVRVIDMFIIVVCYNEVEFENIVNGIVFSSWSRSSKVELWCFDMCVKLWIFVNVINRC